ncbi:hypothetical protein LDK18_08985 [Fusobacterium nucleatum subsp. nucleatum ATCC 23726]|uniref:Uncharacterized protein n=1 Tax=Fusobacterium nucleatum subsp. nucleatum (strain ATCC 23726 / VPI 4351) TaxID=525283 RepID=D5RFR0_FUSN2|nr:hypothetical protein [Fusobacterium nucleatum]AVQ22460.1 hypothetical protein C4N14_01495 [Fusobacterium nucleatum subsp. nucleatum ATCC 23726]EFG94524.1 hypothetical protein HMPREF0397_2045 [Fusobacterium nucleatum subsp. nucleatum ATCC 23726]
MKKILLVLFLVLGVLSFSAPSFIDISKIEKNGYKISGEKENRLLLGKTLEKGDRIENIFISYDFVEENPNFPNSKHQFLKETSPEGLEFTNSFETKRAIIGKYTEINNSYFYTFVSKKNKVKNCYVSVYYATDKNFSKNELEEVCNKFLDEGESFLK